MHGFNISAACIRAGNGIAIDTLELLSTSITEAELIVVLHTPVVMYYKHFSVPQTRELLTSSSSAIVYRQLQMGRQFMQVDLTSIPSDERFLFESDTEDDLKHAVFLPPLSVIPTGIRGSSIDVVAGNTKNVNY